jgi:hypothetical protein
MISRKKVDPTFKTTSDCKQVDLQPGCIELFSIKTDEFISLSKTEEAKIDLKKRQRRIFPRDMDRIETIERPNTGPNYE